MSEFRRNLESGARQKRAEIRLTLDAAIASFGFVGYLRPASGTWGSAAAIPVAWALHAAGGFPLLAAATVLVFALGTWATARHMEATGGKDPSEVVIDEVAGQWVALWPLSLGLWHAGADPLTWPWPGWVGAFFLFRFFDIWKPGPVRWADRRADALGVMLDDVIAGSFAALLLAVGAFVAHGLMGL